MVLAQLLGLGSFNSMPTAEAERALLACCASSRWAARVAAGRPYRWAEELYAVADTALAELDNDDLDQAMTGHPRIGERANGAHAKSSAREQSSVTRSAAATLKALADGNAEYEARFGHVYLVCADGRSGEELLAVLRVGLQNDPATERAKARNELGKINRIRLRRLIGAELGFAG
jgi:2-oxo-4-hydroxy-4-carboxy-5-ureidoimidazoline decarboxylase